MELVVALVEHVHMDFLEKAVIVNEENRVQQMKIHQIFMIFLMFQLPELLRMDFEHI